ncbi:MAG: ABC transporter substrate-binding protein [Deltaproteobacteria bacterium]|nr:ABC transporter substrate-binding protein [Deltaproteobacteria bacterium]MBM4451765.1 ABC transporter substrate-binding protein [Chloroflexota bacterium]
MIKRISRFAWVVALVLVALTLALSCAPKEQVTPAGKKPTEIWLRGSAAMTGIYAASLLPAAEAIKEAVDLINTERGGIDGVPWKVELLDDAGDVAKATATYEQLKVKEPRANMMVFMTTSGVAEALRERFNEDKICVMLPSGSATAIYPAGNTFCIVISHPDGFGFFIDWLAETQPKPVKLGLLNWDSTFGRSIMTDECTNYAKSKGVDIVATELFGIREMDLTTQLTKIKNAGATWVFTNTLGFGTVTVLKSVDALGLKGKMNFAGGHFAMDYDVLRVAEALTEGFVGPHSMVTWDEADNPYVAERRKAFDAAERPDSYRAQPFLVFKGWMTYVADIHEAAIEEVGWENLDAEAFKAQIVKTKDLKLPWTILNYSADKPETNWARMVQFKGGKVLPITDWRKAPDLRPAQYKK